MPDIDFPINPSLNATYSKDGKTWIWDGSRWRTNNILSYSGGGTGYASYTTGDLLVGVGNSVSKFPVGQNNFQYLRVDSVNSSFGVTWISLPLAGSGQSGLVSTLDQTFSGIKTFTSSIIGNLSGTATTSENINITNTTRSLTHYLTFTNQTSGSGLALTTSSVGIGFTVNPAQNTLAAGTFIGNVSGTAITATNFYGTLVGNLTGTATTSQNININTTTRSVDHYLVFSNRSSGSGVALTASTVGSGLTYNPATNTLSALFFTGTATTARNVTVNTTTRNLNHYILFTNEASGSGLALTTSNIGIGFTVNPAENTLSSGLFAGNISGTAGTFANIYGNTFANLTGVEFTSGDVLVKTGKSVKFYEATNVYNTSIKANSSISGNYTYTLPLATPGTGASILQSDTSGNMLWVKAASNKATYVLSFGAGFTPTTGLDSVSLSIPYANDGSTSLTYTIKRVEVRTETEPGASGLAFYFERHTAGNATWTSANTIKGAASANFSVAQNNYSAAFTTITSSSGNNGEVSSGNYLRVNFASVGAAANVSISIMIQEN